MAITKEFVRLKTTELIPYENNPRKNDEAVADVIASVKQCGELDPIEVDENNVILSGLTRLKAYKKLGYKQVDCVRYTGLTDEQKRKYRLLANKTGEKAEWDFDLLNLELDGLDFEGIDFGFDNKAIKMKNADEVVEDEYNEALPEETKVKRGDIFRLGRHRLMCGDSTDAEDWAKLMNGNKADMVFTDPPYGVAIGTKNQMLNSIQSSGRCTENIANDTLNEQELYDVLKKAFENVRQMCKEDAVYYVTSPQGGSLGLMMMMMMMRDAGLPVRHVLMWRKNSPTFSVGRLDYDYQHEPIFYTWTKKHHNFRAGKYRSTIWDFDKPRKCDLHPTMKPVALVSNAIYDGTQEGMNVIDAFGGSGTTIIAAEQTNRTCYMMELDPRYCDVIIQRWETFTGEKAERI